MLLMIDNPLGQLLHVSLNDLEYSLYRDDILRSGLDLRLMNNLYLGDYRAVMRNRLGHMVNNLQSDLNLLTHE